MEGGVAQGMIQGGWGYVIAAYGISWAAMAAYVVSLWLRDRAGRAGQRPT